MYARMTPDRYARDMRVPENYGGNAFRPAPPKTAEPPARTVASSADFPGPETAYSQESYRRLFHEPAEPQADLPPEESEVPPEPDSTTGKEQSVGLLSGGIGKLFGGMGQGIGSEELLLLALILLTAGDNGGDDLFLILLLLLFIR